MKPELYRPVGALYSEAGCCIYCHRRVVGVGGSNGDRVHDRDCPVVLKRLANARLLPKSVKQLPARV